MANQQVIWPIRPLSLHHASTTCLKFLLDTGLKGVKADEKANRLTIINVIIAFNTFGRSNWLLGLCGLGS